MTVGLAGLAGQGAIVTGGARGIGLGVAQRLAREGCRVALWDLAFDALDARAAGFSPVSTHAVDVADYAQVERAFAETERALGTIDILVNNAGINGPVAPTWDYPLAAWDRVLAVDLTGVFYCSRVAIPHMRARSYGRIVNVASIAGKEGNQGIAAYAAAKAAVIGFTKSVAKELVDSGVLVNAIAPALDRDRPVPRDDARAHRARQEPDPDGTDGEGAGNRRDGRLDRESRVQLHHGLHLRSDRGPGDVLSARPGGRAAAGIRAPDDGRGARAGRVRRRRPTASRRA